ncbi:hypothetical protein [Ferrovibrio sp.]|uniref:hypothetical protein n=1 Tax=Ferrovibrio sp. TaxID=1917215 RepID=UPI0031201D0C
MTSGADLLPRGLLPGLTRRLSRSQVLQAVALLLPACWALGYLQPPLNHDAALILDVAGRWLDGARLYVDVIDINPPLVFLLSALPEMLARHFAAVDGPTAFVLMILGLAGGALLLAHRVITLAGSGFGPVSRFLLPPLLAFLLLVYPDDMFGQREHIMLIASMPYLLAAVPRAGGQRLPDGLLWTIMAAAGIGFALKPHFLLAPALVEVCLMALRRQPGLRDPALWWLAAGPALQGFLMIAVMPEYLAEIVPMAFRQYAEQGEAMWAVATGGLIGPVLAVSLPLAGIAVALRGLQLQRLVVLYVLGSAVAAVVQAKGWSYQSLPATAGCLLLVFSTLAGVIDRYLPRRTAAAGAPAIAGLLLLTCYFHGATLGLPFQPQRGFATSDTRRLLDVVQRHAFDGRVMIVSPGVLPHFPMVNYARVRLTGRFESMWLLQGIYGDCGRPAPYNPPARMSADERRIFDGLSADFAHDRPSLVIIDTDAGIPACGGPAFDYLEYFGRNSVFAATLDEYEEITAFGRYRIFQRTTGTDPEEL